MEPSFFSVDTLLTILGILVDLALLGLFLWGAWLTVGWLIKLVKNRD